MNAVYREEDGLIVRKIECPPCEMLLQNIMGRPYLCNVRVDATHIINGVGVVRSDPMSTPGLREEVPST